MTDFERLPLPKKISTLYREGLFIMSIRYYEYKINLYQMDSELFEVFILHKHTQIEKISPLDWSHSRFKFYIDQILLPDF